ncbi:MAG: PGF-pre-PGF domain-containing protein [Candidatus Woesearchaeota archaeon]
MNKRVAFKRLDYLLTKRFSLYILVLFFSFFSHKALASTQNFPPNQPQILTPDGQVETDVLFKNINFNVTDSDNTVLSCKMYVNGTGNVSNSTTRNNTQTWLNLSVAACGYYVYYINCSDGEFYNISATQWILFNYSIDSTPPIIGSVENVSITNSSAIIKWITDDISNSTVYYGTTQLLGSSSYNATMTNNHSVLLTDLSNNTLYYYNVSSCNSAGYCSVSLQYSFTTEQNFIPGPVISNVLNISITNTTAVVTWETDLPTDSLVKYGMSSGIYSENISNSTLTTTHLIELTGLMPDTTYYYVVNSTDGNSNSSESDEMNFTTVDTIPPSINSVYLTSYYIKNNTPVTVYVNATDNHLLQVTAEGTPLVQNGDVWEGTIPLSSSPLDIVAIDERGNNATDSSVNFVVDGTPPTIHSITISKKYVKNNTKVEIIVNASDAVNVTAEGTPLSREGDRWNGTIALLDTPPWFVDVVAYDNVSNTAFDNSLSYIIDDIAPIINSIILSQDYVRNNTNVTIYVNITESSISNVSADDVLLSEINGIWSGAILLKDIGQPTFVTVEVYDNAGNFLQNTNTTFIVDEQNPQINSVTISDGYVSTGQKILVTVNATDTRMQSVTANSLEMINTSPSIWFLNLTIPSSSGTITILATDAAGNTKSNSSASFVVDNTAPVISIAEPQNNSFYSKNNITFNFSVYESNLSSVNITIDNKRYYGSSINGSQTANFTDLCAGMHKAVLTAIDEAENKATKTIRFTIAAPLNVTQKLNELKSEIGLSAVNISLKKNETELYGNESVDINGTLSLEINLNVSGINGSIRIHGFNGLNADWDTAFYADTNASSEETMKATQRSGTEIEYFVLIKNTTEFIEDTYYDLAVIVFNTALNGRDVLFIGDDNGEDIYKLHNCTSTPSVVSSLSDACYIETEHNVTLYLPHFSGGAIANDTLPPIINISSPENATIIQNSYFDFEFSVYEANPNNFSLCNYSVFNGTDIVYYDYDIEYLDMTNNGSTLYEKRIRLYDLANGTYYFNLSCQDMNNQSSNLSYIFFVNDTIEPEITSIGPTGLQTSSTTSKVITISAITDENSYCRYATSNLSYFEMTEPLGSFGTSHTTQITYNSDASVTMYVRCIDVNGIESVAGVISYTVDVGISSSGKSTNVGSSGGGIIGNATTIEVFAWSKTLKNITAENSISILVTNKDLSITELKFVPVTEVPNAYIYIRETKEKPERSGEFLQGVSVYRYIKIVDDSFRNISGAVIDFRVEKSWLEANQLKQNNVGLYRLSSTEGEGKWVLQNTSKTSEDGQYIYYRANTTGLSYFAIGGKHAKDELNQDSTSVFNEQMDDPSNQSNINENAEMNTKEIESASQEGNIQISAPVPKIKIETKRKISISWLIAFILIIIVLAVASIIYVTKIYVNREGGF